MKDKVYTVWVGGIEVNDHYLDIDEAIELVNEYKSLGYNDAVYEKVL